MTVLHSLSPLTSNLAIAAPSPSKTGFPNCRLITQFNQVLAYTPDRNRVGRSLAHRSIASTERRLIARLWSYGSKAQESWKSPMPEELTHRDEAAAGYDPCLRSRFGVPHPLLAARGWRGAGYAHPRHRHGHGARRRDRFTDQAIALAVRAPEILFVDTGNANHRPAYSHAAPCGPALLVTQDPERTSAPESEARLNPSSAIDRLNPGSIFFGRNPGWR